MAHGVTVCYFPIDTVYQFPPGKSEVQGNVNIKIWELKSFLPRPDSKGGV